MLCRTSYHYTLASGQTILLQEGVNGITQELISELDDLDRLESNAERRERKYVSALVEFEKGAVYDDGNVHADPIENLADSRWSPEFVLFSEERRPSLLDSVEAVVPMLTSLQRELFRMLRMGLTEGEIASSYGISRNAVKSRKRFLIAAIRRNMGIPTT